MSEIEGMPGTWSACGNRSDHAPHRHRIVMNEGPYENILCRGVPGDPLIAESDVPLAEIWY